MKVCCVKSPHDLHEREILIIRGALLKYITRIIVLVIVVLGVRNSLTTTTTTEIIPQVFCALSNTKVSFVRNFLNI